jgi:hypothetical protein
LDPILQNFRKRSIWWGRVVLFVVNTENSAFLIENELFDKIKRAQLEIKMNAYMSANTNLSEKIMVYVSRYLDK